MKFETALAELEDIVASMEGGKLELEASIAAYKRGMELMKHCQAQLADAEAADPHARKRRVQGRRPQATLEAQ
jgi:exodeoxyribonuclease VII small subunit